LSINIKIFQPIRKYHQILIISKSSNQLENITKFLFKREKKLWQGTKSSIRDLCVVFWSDMQIFATCIFKRNIAQLRYKFKAYVHIQAGLYIAQHRDIYKE